MTKAEFINEAYSRMRISGLTVQPNSEEIKKALRRLENLAAEWADQNICVGYNFETQPDVNSPHNVDRKYWNAFETGLAMRLIADFGKQPHPTLMAEHLTSFSRMSASAAQVNEVPYPTRQPIGSGNRWRGRSQRYYGQAVHAPVDCETKIIFVDDINNYKETFSAYLVSPENISSYTIEADDGLTILSDSLTSPVVDYQIEAAGDAGEVLRVKIVATTTLGRKETRIINFELKDSDL